MAAVILDCYTDEPSGLGVPPYLGVYPRYLFGYLEEAYYLTIDDIRYFFGFILKNKKYDIKKQQKTNIKIYNQTKNIYDTKRILQDAEILYVILGVHTPGKYLSALPGTLNELNPLLENIRQINSKIRIILAGPAVYGTQLYGGKFSEKINLDLFDRIESLDLPYKDIAEYAVKGASVMQQISGLRIIEIETSHGCNIGKCSFCTEPLKHKLEFRDSDDIIAEIRAFYEIGLRYFRIGKQSCFYTYPRAAELLEIIRAKFPKIKVLHIDNVNPVMVLKDNKDSNKITKAIVKYCTPGNIAAFGVESFDESVVKENCLNCNPEQAFEAVKILNRFGAEQGGNGMPKFLPGINILFGLKGETKQTNEQNMLWLQKILDSGLLLRRINIRQVTLFEGAPLYKECGNKFLKKNKKYYWKWRNNIRQNIDFPMLKNLVPESTILNDARAEIYDGNTTFLRQIGTYPLIIGVKKRLELGKFYNVRIIGHMLRSVVGEVV